MNAMEIPKSDSKLSSSTEYALIFGAGASAAMSLAAQQVPAASVPLTALVAIGLINRRRLDQKIKASEPTGPGAAEQAVRHQELPQAAPVARPAPEMISAQPSLMNSVSPIRFSTKQQRLMADRQAHKDAQQNCLAQIGHDLKQEREGQGLSLQDIHCQTYIQRYALEAIEQGDLDALPEPFYIRAFIRKYAIALRLNAADTVARFPIS